MKTNIEYRIYELETNRDIGGLCRLQEEIANKIALGNNVKENIAIQRKIGAAISSVREQLDRILTDYIFDDDVDDINSSNLM